MSIKHLAESCCIIAHGAIGQLRQYSNEPYSNHPLRVARQIELWFPEDHNLYAAACLHDVVEDTKVSKSYIASIFNHDVAQLVSDVTKISKLSDGNRAARCKIDRQHLAQGSARAQNLKLLDIDDNTSTLIVDDITRASSYIPEKILVLDILTKADKELFTFVKQLLFERQELITKYQISQI